MLSLFWLLQIATYEAEFKATDADGNGFLTKEELVATFTRLGMSEASAKAVAADYIDNHDTSGDGTWASCTGASSGPDVSATARVLSAPLLHPAPRLLAGKISWKEFVAVYEKQRARLAEEYESAAASLASRFKAAKAPAEGLPKDDAVALVRAMGEAGDMVAGTDNGESAAG